MTIPLGVMFEIYKDLTLFSIILILYGAKNFVYKLILNYHRSNVHAWLTIDKISQ